jgi:predicted GNAT family acetyltransferase
MDVRHNSPEQRFDMEHDGVVAMISYRERNGVLRLVHTEVPESMGGGGVGGALVKAAFDYARQHQLKVQPLCSFAAAWLKRHPEYSDVQYQMPSPSSPRSS